MTDRPKNSEQVRRQHRLGAALRENLKRRKAQAKGRSEGRSEDRSAPAEERPDTPHDSAGIATDKRKS